MIVLIKHNRNLLKNISCNKLTYVSNCFLKISCNPSFLDLAYLSILSLVAVVDEFDALLLTSNCMRYSVKFYYSISHDFLPGHCDLISRTCTNKKYSYLQGTNISIIQDKSIFSDF
jgi:hypothetical protein